MSTTIPSPMIHKYLHFARHSLTTPLHSPSTATLLAFFAAQHPTSELFSNAFGLFRCPAPHFGTLKRHFCPFSPPETSLRNPSGDTFALFRHPTPPVGTLRRHFCPFLPPDTSRRNPQATLLPFFAARHLTSKIPNDTLDHFCHPESMQPIFPDSTVDSSIAPKTTFY